LPLIAAAGASPFVLKQKDQKFKTAGRLLCRAWPYPANQGKPGLESLRLYPLCPRFGKNSYALPLRAGPTSFSLISAEAFLLSDMGS